MLVIEFPFSFFHKIDSFHLSPSYSLFFRGKTVSLIIIKLWQLWCWCQGEGLPRGSSLSFVIYLLSLGCWCGCWVQERSQWGFGIGDGSQLVNLNKETGVESGIRLDVEGNGLGYFWLSKIRPEPSFVGPSSPYFMCFFAPFFKELAVSFF